MQDNVANEDVKGRDLKLDEWAKEDLAVRKKYELKLMKKFDKINTGKECWFLVDCMWLNRWSEFVNTDSLELPGPISSADLLDGNNNPIAGLKPKIDYRALPAVAFFILKQLHGSDGSPDLPRYSLDIYKPPVPIDRLVNIQMTAVCEANVQVNKYRSKWMTWDVPYDDEEDSSGMFWCCGLTKEHLEAFIYWAVHCWRWGRKSSGRKDISYRQYKPLRGTPDDSIHGNSRHGSMQGSQHGGSLFGGSRHGDSEHGGSQHDGDDLDGGDDGEGSEEDLKSGREANGKVGGWDAHGKPSRGGLVAGRGKGYRGKELDGSTHNVMHPRSQEMSRQGIRESKLDDSDCYDASSSSEDEMGVGPADKDHGKGRWLQEIIK